MLPEIKQRWDRMDGPFRETIHYVQGLSEQKQHQSPAGEWSAVQILHHLHISEKGTTAYLFKKLQTPPEDVEKAGIKGIIRSFLLRRALRNMKKKFRAPKVLGEMPDKPDFEEVKAGLEKNRKALKSILETVSKTQVSRAYFKHPRAGRIDIVQTLDFLDDHFNRHAAQIRQRSA